MSTDLTFITNEENRSLAERFRVLIRNTQYFDVLVGYFFSNGFYSIYKSLENTEKVRILVGISTNQSTYELIDEAKNAPQMELQFSSAEAKEQFSCDVVCEMEESKDNIKVEEGVQKFQEWIRSGKLEIRAYPSSKIHAKLYIMGFPEDHIDKGRVITGSSNFSRAGLQDNLEFNVELKNRSDYEFAKKKFEELWKDGVDVSEEYVQTIQEKTWLNDTIMPYELYLKFLYEYFRADLNRSEEMVMKYVPEEFKELEYQEQAVMNAKKIIEEYGGVFISDVVGLGKTYMAALLAQQLPGRHLVIAPPALLDKKNPGSWENVFYDFGLPKRCESIGKLDQLLKEGVEKYDNVFIDEAHRFRAETNITYEHLARICRGKRIILVTATPYNNSLKDILSQIKLFQKTKKSTIPNLPDLETFFGKLERRLNKLDRKNNAEEYILISKENAREVRDKVLKYLMVRRTRTEIEKYYGADLKKQGMKFPTVTDPKPIFYELNSEEDRIFSKTISLIASSFSYARYMPISYYKGKTTPNEELAQRNVGKFMKILLIKRLESSFHAFRNTLRRFIESHEKFLKEFDAGNVYISKKHSNKIFELLENDDDESIQKLIDDKKAEKLDAKDFKKELRIDVEKDLKDLKDVLSDWESITRDPKIEKFSKEFESNKLLQSNKIIVFTESKETALYLEKNLRDKVSGGILCFHGQSGAPTREKVIENFDARARHPRDDYRVLVSTEVLSEGVNLHRSNTVINYDIPWNPTRLMQRVGRINRVDTKFPNIYTFNFFPTEQSNEQIKLKEAAENKIHAFIEMLGNDAQLLTEGEEIKSQELFQKLSRKETLTGEDEDEESELKYLEVIREIQKGNPDLFEKIKRLPKKARTARSNAKLSNTLLSYFRKGKLEKFYTSSSKGETLELDFFGAAQLLETKKETKRTKLDKLFYDLLEKNKKAFEFSTTEDIEADKQKGGRDNAVQILKILRLPDIRTFKAYTEEGDLFMKKVVRELEEGGLPKQTTKKLLPVLRAEIQKGINPLRILGILQTHVPIELLNESVASSSANTSGPREVILSEYFTN